MVKIEGLSMACLKGLAEGFEALKDLDATTKENLKILSADKNSDPAKLLVGLKQWYAGLPGNK